MKKQIIKVAMVLLPVCGFSQMVVHDPVQEANMAQQISNSSQQVVQMEKSLEYMQKSAEKLNKVNSYLRNLQDLEKITRLYKESISLAQKARNNVSKIKGANSQRQAINDIAGIISSLEQGIRFVSQILSNDFYSMTDKDRMDLINKERRKILMKRVRLLSYTK